LIDAHHYNDSLSTQPLQSRQPLQSTFGNTFALLKQDTHYKYEHGGGGKGLCNLRSEEKHGELLIAAPCGRHWVCRDDVSSFFRHATQNESLFPPRCCDQMFMLQEYEEYVPFDIAWAYQVKEQGEYALLAK
jgi:hypothetical protein